MGSTILLNRGDGTFRPRMEIPTDYPPNALVARDFNGDGKLDLAGINGGLVVYLNQTQNANASTGDLDGDGAITLKDVLWSLEIAVSERQPILQDDVNEDGKENIGDTILLLNTVVGKTPGSA